VHRAIRRGCGAGDYASAYIAAGFLAVMAGVIALTMRRRSADLGVAAAPA